MNRCLFWKSCPFRLTVLRPGVSVGSPFHFFSVEMVFLSAAFLPDDWLLVGTKPGHLLLYRIKKDAGGNRCLTWTGYRLGIVKNVYIFT